MASLVDAMQVLNNLGIITIVIVFILLLAILYGIFTKYQPFGENKTLNAIIAVAISLIVTSFVKAALFIQLLVPMVVAVLVVILFITVALRFLGVVEDDITTAIKSSVVGWGLIVTIIVLFTFIAFNTAFPEQAEVQLPPRAGSAFEQPARGEVIVVGSEGTAQEGLRTQDILSKRAADTIFNPVVLGMILMLLVFVVAAYMIVRQ